MLNKVRGMTQEERWMVRYEEVMAFIESNHRNPSRHRIEEHDMLNWVKANRKALNAGKMKDERVEAFKKLLAMMEHYRRKNQYE
jgi:Helicase associated domain.